MIMKICDACGATYDADSWQCIKCLKVPTMINNFPAFSPDLAVSNSGFKNEFFGKLAMAEAGSFWFQSRNRLITWSLKKYFSSMCNFFEIGCGTAFVLSGIKKCFPRTILFGSDIFSSSLSYARERLPNVTLFQMDARTIPFRDEFDVIGAFDVLEHIEEDGLVLSQMHQALRSNGGIILTVPQHKFLWSKEDERACHVRRYTRNELQCKVEAAGFKVLRMTSFVSLLLPMMFFSRLMKQKNDATEEDALNEMKLPKLINYLFYNVMKFELILIKCGINFSFGGGSLLLIARKIG